MAKNENLETTEVSAKSATQSFKVSKKDKAIKKPAKADKAPKKSRIKETFSELKKVTWPSFGKAMKQTGTVLTIVLVFGLLVLGIDLFISWIITLLSSF